MTVRFAIFRASALGIAVSAGCRGCPDEHPYVPYAIGSAEPVSPSSRSNPAALASREAAGDASPFLKSPPATVAPPGSSQWSFEGLALVAPEGFVFELALGGDFDGDGQADAFAVVRPVDATEPGQAVFYAGKGDGGPLGAKDAFSAPKGVGAQAGCVPADRLASAGHGAVVVELGVACPDAPSRTPSRWVAVIKGGAPPVLKLAATVADPADAPALAIDAAVFDSDGDARDDVALRVSIDGGQGAFEPGQGVVATVAWIDRPAGLSRDLGATETSFRALATRAAIHAGRLSDAPEVPSYVSQVRTLFRAICVEGGAPRIMPVAGAGAIGCDVGRALEDVGLAEVRAYAMMRDPLRAALAIDRAERAPALRTPSRLAEAQKWIGDIAPAATARMLRAVAAIPAVARGHEPAWGALAFEPSGKLLVRTRAGVVRVDADEGDETAAADVADWKAAVSSPDGAMRWIEAYDPCDGRSLRATFELASGDDARDIALPLSPSLGGLCAGARGAPAKTTAVAWGPGGLEAIVDGQPVLVAPDLAHAVPLATFLYQPPSPGSPRSPDGKWVVIPTGSGFVVVHDDARTRILRASELDATYAEQRDCAVSNDATHVACVRAGKAWVGTWDAL